MSSARRRNVVLIGYRGSGKTTAGTVLAQSLGLDFVDTDEVIEQRAQKRISQIFAQNGETQFRAMERDIIRELTMRDRLVISVGGGAVIEKENRDALRKAGMCFWLTAPAEVLHARLQADPRSATLRPPLSQADPLEEIRTVLETRNPLYAAIADHVIDTENRSLDAVAASIRQCLDAPA